MISIRRRSFILCGLLVLILSPSLWAQQSTTANSTWSGGAGPWNSSAGWTTNGTPGLAIPNNGNTVICNVDQQCKAFFNVTIGSGGTDFVTLGQVPITIDSLTLGASTGRSTLVIGSSAGSTLTIGDINAPAVAPAEVTVNSTGLLTVNPGSELELSGRDSTFDFNIGGVTQGASNPPGAGFITLSDNAGNSIQGVTGSETLVNDAHETLSGAGTISNLALVNRGTIIAGGKNPLNIIPNGQGFINSGSVQAASGSTLTLDTTAADNAMNIGLNNSYCFDIEHRA